MVHMPAHTTHKHTPLIVLQHATTPLFTGTPKRQQGSFQQTTYTKQARLPNAPLRSHTTVEREEIIKNKLNTGQLKAET